MRTTQRLGSFSAAALFATSALMGCDGSSAAGPSPESPGSVAQLAAGADFSWALRSDSTVWSWGNNTRGQLGRGAPDNTVPGQIPGLTGIIQIAAGYYNGIALRADGTVWVAGYNDNGQIGNGTTSFSGAASGDVTGLTNVIQVAGGDRTNLALKSDGTVWQWGMAYDAAIPTGWTSVSVTVPRKVNGLSNITAISVGEHYNLALKSDGTVWAWGLNSTGQMGGAPSGPLDAGYVRVEPLQVPGLVGIGSLDAGSAHGLALSNAGTIFGWGHGGGSTASDCGQNTHPAGGLTIPFPPLSRISGGALHSAAMRKTTGDVIVWGCNQYGQLGNGTTTPLTAYVSPAGMTNVLALSAGYNHTLVLKADGTVWGWGDNRVGQLGDGTKAASAGVLHSRTSPVQVVGLNLLGQ